MERRGGYGNRGGDGGHRGYGGQGSYGGQGGYGGGSRGGYGGGQSVAPVKEGEIIDVRIEAVGEKGDGIAKRKGFVLFVPNTKEGDEVKVKVTKVLQKVGFAEVVGQATPGSAASEEKPREKQKPKEEDELIPAGEDSENFGEEVEVPSEEEATDDDDSEENIDEPPQPD